MQISDESLDASRPSSTVDSRRAISVFIRRNRTELIVCASIAISWLLVWPVGEYALLDDWAYARSLKTLHDEARVEVLDWNPMSLVGHLIWAIGWTKVLGFSLSVARLAVVALHVVECLTLVRLLRSAGVGERLTLAAALSLVFNPLHFVHCYTFMTDIPAITWSLLALAVYAGGLFPGSKLRWLWLLGGGLASGMAFLSRQNGILVPAAFFLYAVAWDRALLRARLLFPAFGPVVVIVGTCQWWYLTVHGATSTYQASFAQIRQFAGQLPWADIPRIGYSYLIMFGWLALPLTAGLAESVVRGSWTIRRWLWLGSILLVANGFAVYVLGDGRLFPFIWNVITPYGYFEPDSLFAGRSDMRWNESTGFVLALVCALSAMVVLRAIAGDRSQEQGMPEAMVARQSALRRLTVVLIGLQAAYCVATAPILFDRHLLILAPTTIVLVVLYAATAGVRLQPVLYVACLVPAAWYSIAGTHDLHAASRAFWDVGSRLIAEGSDPATINAGYAFDGWHTYERMETRRGLSYSHWWDLHWWQKHQRDKRSHSQPPPLTRKGWWYGIVRPDIEPRFIVALLDESDESLPDQEYSAETRVSFRNWWPWKLKQVVALRIPAAEDRVSGLTLHDQAAEYDEPKIQQP